MPLLNEFSFTSCNCRSKIYVRQWLPQGTPVGVVQICHGVAEHIERYDDFAQSLADRGFVVAGADHLGHGKSAGDDELGFFGENGGWELVVGDVRKLYELLREQYHNLPIFMFGHSMGSFLVRTYAIRYHDGPDGIILSGTGQQGKPLLTAGIAMAKFEIKRHGASYHSELLHKMAFGSYNNKIKHPKTDSDWLSTDEKVVEDYINNPFCGFTETAGLFRDLFSGIKFITTKKNLLRINMDLPIFMIAGTADPVGDYGKGVQRAYNEYLDAGLSNVTLKLYNGARHEILNDFCKNEVYADVLAWLNSKIKPTPSEN